MKVNCFDSNCSKCCKNSLQSIIVAPFEAGTDDIRRLFSYFLYRAPNIESAHSVKIPDTMHHDVFSVMMENRHFKYERFCNSNAKMENELSKGYLNGSDVCLKCKRYVCKRKQAGKNSKKESDLECFLRHIRNAIAHGRVYYCHTGNKIHIVFEDENDSKNLSARIVCVKADLEHWKKVLSDKKYYPHQ